MCDRVLVSDIDGTLLRDGEPTAGLETLKRMIDQDDPGTRLIYATGRTVESVLERVRDRTLPPAHAIAALVGTEVWFPPWTSPDESFFNRIDDGWDLGHVSDIAAAVDEIEPQPEEFQSPRKLSFFAESERPVQELGARLHEAGSLCRLIYSGGRFLDLIPKRAGKRASVEFITSTWNAADARVLAAGDSLNDHDMLVHPEYFGVVVANADAELNETVNGPRLHEASLPFAAGVLEGAEVFDFWAEKPRRSTTRRR